MNKEGGSLKHVCHCTCEGQTEVKSKQQNKEPVTLSLPTPGCLLLWPNLVPSSCLPETRNAHLFPLIKGIIIYNFLLKNQLCILSIAGRNSHFVTWLEKIDQNSRLWKEKKTSKIIYRCKKPCCRTVSNYEDFLQCIKIKDFLKIIALGFQTHLPPLCKAHGFQSPRASVSARTVKGVNGL